jgi:hydroxymethylpyrimidine/phosphomethylpyrimidine kinase
VLQIVDEADMRDAAAMIRAMGAQAVLIKGGHLANESEETRD